MDKIRRVSLMFRRFFVSVFIVLPVFVALVWLFIDEVVAAGLYQFVDVGSRSLKDIPIEGPITPLTKMLGFLVTMIPTSIHMVVLYFLIKLFGLYSQGEIFAASNVGYIRKIGYMLLIGQAFRPFVEALTTLVLTMNNPVGERMISIGFTRTDVTTIVIALMIILVSWIMDEGRKLKDLEEYTI